MGTTLIGRVAGAIALAAALSLGTARAQNYSDIWFDSGESGWGLTVADHESQLFAVWFTYRQDGRPTWYVIPGGTMSGDRLHFQGDVYATTGPAYTSAPFDPARVTATKVGTAAIDFTPSGTATFTYNVGGVSQAKPIQRQPFGNAASAWGADVTDIWWNPSASGWGLTLAQHGDNVFGVWFTYDTDGQPLWVVMPGVTFSGPDSFTGTLYTTTGPYFGAPSFDASRVTATAQGSATLAVNREGHLDLQCTGSQNATFSWSLRNASGSESICQQAFGELPGPAAPDLGITDPLPASLDLSHPGSFSSVALGLVTSGMPELSSYAPAVSSAEQSIWVQLLAQIPGGKRTKAGSAKSGGFSSLMATAMVGATTGMMSFGQLPKGTSLPGSPHSTTNEGITVTGSLGGGRSADGTTHAEFSFSASGDTPSGPVLLNSSAEFQGLVCPAADGSVPFKLHVIIGGHGGSGAKLTGGQIEVLLAGTASVNDSANIQQIDFDWRLQESLQRPDSHNAYVDASFKGTMRGEMTQGYHPETTIKGKINRTGSTTTNADRDSMLVNDLSPVASVIMAGYLALLQNNWQDGACVKVVASAPGTVAPGSTTSIDARVHHKPDDIDLPLPIDATLAGGASLQPPRIEKSPGTFIYVAPGQTGQSATITLKTKSRRGIDELTLPIRTASEGYAVDWSDGQGNHVFGTICGGLGSAFTLNFTSGTDIQGTLAFTPTGASGGNVHLSGTGLGGVITYAGDGTYTLTGSTAIQMTIPQQIGTVQLPTGPQVIPLPGPSGTLPLQATTQCNG